jgi:hypothetical protein
MRLSSKVILTVIPCAVLFHGGLAVYPLLRLVAPNFRGASSVSLIVMLGCCLLLIVCACLVAWYLVTDMDNEAH